jgi:predicted DsbA family dithiol-disulfide isomerase
LKIDIWSDVVCPWCYVGKRRFESALAEFEHRPDVEIRWRSFELDPSAPAVRQGDGAQRLADKYGMSRAQAIALNATMTERASAEGLEFNLDAAQSGNTFDAHRLLHLAADRGIQDQLKERFMRGYFTEGAAVGEHETLTRLAVDAGLEEAEVRDVLSSDAYAADVRADEEQAAAYGISGVPFFVIDEQLGVSGAQPAELLLSAMRQAWTTSHPLTMVTTAADQSCEGDACAV